jgi:ABC-type nitrate/sulfonate/bicarbonate transport system permease component
VQIPVLAWLPFVLLLVGIGEPLKYILIAKAALVPVALNTLQGFRQTPAALREVGQVYGFSRRQEVLEIVLPHAVPTIFTGVRLGFTKAWLSLVVVELVASSEGLGYLIVYGRQLFQLTGDGRRVRGRGDRLCDRSAVDRLKPRRTGAVLRRAMSAVGRDAGELAGPAAAARWRRPLARLRSCAGGHRCGWLLSSLASSTRRCWFRWRRWVHGGGPGHQRPPGRSWASLAREATGFVIGSVTGLVLGAPLGLSPLSTASWGRASIPSSRSRCSRDSADPVWFGLGDGPRSCSCRWRRWCRRW